MHECAADIQIFLATRHKKPGGGAIEHDADRSHPDDNVCIDNIAVTEAPHGFPCDRADCDEQKNRIEQRGHDRRAPPPISAPRGRRTFRQITRAPCENQPEHITEVVSRIREQRERVAENSEDNLHEDIGNVQSHTDGERTMEIRWSVGMVVIMRHDYRRKLHLPFCTSGK